MENNSIKEFTENFFKNIKSEFKWKDSVLIVTKVPKDFEDYYGKKVPYYLVFDREYENNNTDLITKGSFLIKSMASYLENRGQTALLKIKFDIDEKQKFSEFYRLGNCELGNSSKKIKYDFLVRFTFLTILQYLNEKKQIVSSLYVYKNSVIDFNIDNFEVSEGKKEDISFENIKDYYSVAKERLKIIIQPNISEISHSLNPQLNKELERVKNHYKHQLKEIDDEYLSLEIQIKELESQIIGATDLEIKNIRSKVNRLRENIEKIKSSNLEKREKLQNEEKFFINDEISKYSLNISNKLINTTLIYYPDFIFNITLKNKFTRTSLNLNYDELNKKIEALKCFDCNSEIKEIYLCSSGHISCKNCLEVCKSCGKSFCLSCLNETCEYCGRNLCKLCFVKCSNCGKSGCKSHMKIDFITKKIICENCSRRCSVCKEYVLLENMVKCPNCSRFVCKNCSKSEFIKINGKILCKGCSMKCPTCGNIKEKTSFKKCENCIENCNYLDKCFDCRKQLCVRLKRKLNLK